jgi:hypothetical protein
MTKRTTTKNVTFRRPFVLKGLDGIQAAGTYAVDTDEEMIEASFIAFRTIATLIRVERGGTIQVFAVDPVELNAALVLDAGLTPA